MVANKVNCIIPFYNEGKRILSVLQKITEISEFNKIICVDDCSNDKVHEMIKKQWPDLIVHRLEQNVGKTHAIRCGLDFVDSEFVFLLDADLLQIQVSEIQNAIHSMQNCDVDMIILRRIGAPWFVKMDRGDVLFSGERILYTEDLRTILKQDIERYQLEIAINHWMLKNKKKVYWLPSSASNTFKTEKMGVIPGFWKEMEAFLDIVSFIGLDNYFTQIHKFAKQRYHSEKKSLS